MFPSRLRRTTEVELLFRRRPRAQGTTLDDQGLDMTGAATRKLEGCVHTGAAEGGVKGSQAEEEQGGRDCLGVQYKRR